jgi:restriction endonuclease S subunit
MTSSIARMNCFLHGIEDFRIERGDTLAEPKLVEGDRLQRFDVVLANPPYSIKQWNREAFAADPWGRNVFGVPPQGRADYAFQQHILQSLKPKTGRCAVLWPHGILFRNEEDDIRRKLIESDYIEAVIGLGPNLFYNSSMQSCIVICRTNKAPKQRRKILFIDAVNEVTRERTQSFLTRAHIDRIVQALRTFNTEEGFAKAATLEEIKGNQWSLNIPLYVQTAATKTLVRKDTGNTSGDAVLDAWLDSRNKVRNGLAKVVPEISEPHSTETLKPDIVTALARFDRTKWKKATLGDVCDEISVRIDNPASSGNARFVGLEHFDSGNLKIRRWGSTENLESAMKVFSSGDVLFARRNAYLKRASLADFDGVCSGDAIVLRERHEAIVPGFLAFLLNTNRFWEFAIANAAGTMSRRVNGKTLMRFEFDLPPLDQQRRIAEILWAVDNVAESAWTSREAILALRKSAHSEVFVSGLDKNATTPTRNGIPAGWIETTVGEACIIENRLRKPINAAERAAIQGEYPYFGPTGILDHLNEFRIEGEYVLIGEDGDHFLKFDSWNMTHLVKGRFNVNNHAHVLRGTDACQTEWIFQYFKHRDITPFLSRQGAGRLKMQKSVLEKMPFVVPPVKEQEEILGFFRRLDSSVDQINEHLVKTNALLAALTNELFESQ